MLASFPSADLSQLTRDLLAWYDTYAATLPWRGAADPYRIWLSEIMLQQTQIATVAPYNARFIARFPTVGDLAAAPLDAVLKVWEGLGYYSRARNLHRAAQQIAVERGGQFPQNAADWQTLTGVGRYTAGAIASITLGERVAALDGNAIRVLSRLFDITEDVTRPATIRQLWTVAESLVPADRPGAYNQALMDLGRTICTARRPQCNKCPVASHCRAFRAGTQAQRPVKAPRSPLSHEDVIAGFVYNAAGEILLAQRPAKGLLGGLWGLPAGTLQPGELAQECLRRTLSVTSASAVDLEIGEQVVVVQHAFTHFRMTLHVHRCRWLLDHTPTLAVYANCQWLTHDQVDILALARADRRALDALRQADALTTYQHRFFN